jgi:predicted nucleotidyltransferase
MNLQKDLREFVELLSALEVRFVVVGAFAVAYHGYFRYTSDIDLFVDGSIENAERILKAVEQFGFGDLNLTVGDFSRDQIIQLGVAPNRIDMLTALSGVSFDDVWASRVEAVLDGVKVFFISKEMLKRNKKACGRLQDLADLEYL